MKRNYKLIAESLRLFIQSYLLLVRSIFVTFGNKRYVERAVLSKEIRNGLVNSITSISKLCMKVVRKENRGKDSTGKFN